LVSNLIASDKSTAYLLEGQLQRNLTCRKNLRNFVKFRITVLHASVKVLPAGVEDPCLHRPENRLERQLNGEPKAVYKVGLIREKGKAIAREVQWRPETSSLLLR
jgi:hypothetical protein